MIKTPMIGVRSRGVKRQHLLVENCRTPICQKNCDSIVPLVVPWKSSLGDGIDRVRFIVHDADDEQNFAYLAASDEAEPVYVNRLLVDADVVIPISAHWPHQGRDHDVLYPNFSNAQTQSRFRGDGMTDPQRESEQRLANDVLGLFFEIGLECRPGNRIGDVVAGARADVVSAVSEGLDNWWSLPASPDVDCVLATIETSRTSQTWDDIAQAFINAAEFSARGSAIIVWSDLSAPPSAALRRVFQEQFDVDRFQSHKSTTFQMLTRVIGQHRLYLRSRLKPQSVEDLGIGFVESAAQAERLAAAAQQPAMIRDAHRRLIGKQESVSTIGSRS